ncbi:hypothetical protein PN441_15815 [Spirulina major CS-329]|uniref:hypothetical protein n=1 Tax=Spirulina TaxID=1154 RepID=UPI0023313EDE|nr:MULTISPECIES: hypothetical protein [Spirulina]MDB9494297.1 hypothetical protein [Spirulina subsalsa CS-330]MDB9504544.1 hypothetical protein [Spirulina major CS-329]
MNAARLTLPEPTTQPDHPNALNNLAANTAPGDRVFRPNGIHTRIIPEWSPGLYQ